MIFFRLPLARVATVVIIIACGLGLMQLIYAARLGELGQSLEYAADKTMALRTLGLIARYEMIRNRIRSGETIGLLRQEAAAAFASGDSLAAENAEQRPLAYELGLGIINIVNVVAGGPKLRTKAKSRMELLTEQAYLLELKRNFSAAAGIYDQLIQILGAQGGELAGFARLHRGYCLSFLEDRRRAADDFRIVIQSDLSGEYRFTAEVLLSYLEEFNRVAAEINKMPASAKKGSALFDAGAYPQAIDILESLPAGKKTEQSEYVLGRSYEEIGKSDRALANYRRIIAQNPSSKYARLANRRIYALGSMYAAGENLVREAEKAAMTSVADPELIREKNKNMRLVAAVNAKSSQAENSMNLVPMPQPERLPGEPAKGAGPVGRARSAFPRPAAQPLNRSEWKQLIGSKTIIDEVTLNDGNRLWGIITSESKNDLTMLTVMGRLSIDKKQVDNRQKISATRAFKPR